MRKFLSALTHLDAADWRRAAGLSALATLISLVFPAVAAAQALNIDLGTGAGLSERVVQMVGLLTVLSLAPSIVIMTTSFVRIVVVLGLLAFGAGSVVCALAPRMEILLVGRTLQGVGGGLLAGLG